MHVIQPRLGFPWILVDIKVARKTNIQTKREAICVLHENGCVAIFPGGGVATRPFGLGDLQEFPWSSFVAIFSASASALSKAKIADDHIVSGFSNPCGSHSRLACALDITIGSIGNDTIALHIESRNCVFPKDSANDPMIYPRLQTRLIHRHKSFLNICAGGLMK